MYYTIRHITRFRYSAPISESVMELRMQPRSEQAQHCMSFEVQTSPQAKVVTYSDYLNNIVHHFDVPRAHTQLEIITQALVESNVQPPPDDYALDGGAWQLLDQQTATGREWDFLQPSHFVQWTALLAAFAQEIGVQRQADPFTTLSQINSAIYERFAYVPQSTTVDSLIDQALENRRGVCQDYSHVMLGIVRNLGIPSRYVSGYLFHRTDAHDRSAADATHAWIEAWLPDLGWVGFDPTNNLVAGDRHIRVAVGRDYADVPPTRGVFKGGAASNLEVSVQVLPADQPLAADQPSELSNWAKTEALMLQHIQEQQQQQQQ